MSMRIRTVFSTFFINLTAISAFAGQAFESCPSEAFLFQGNPVQVYGVNLLTGQFELLQSDAGIPGNINGVGFNFDDRYIYGFNTSSFEVVRVDRDFQAETLPVFGLPERTTFYVGDVFDNIYWVYRRNVGLYRIDVDPQSVDYLIAQKITGAEVSLNLTDFAFHPQDSELYAVDNTSGFLYRLSLATGQFEFIGQTGVTGTFGAAYFDVNGYMYLGRNSDGHIFRINLSDLQNPIATADLFAIGPYSSQNDGARCAFAPIVSSDVDWGDAPETYATSIESNGPRHQITESLWLGSSVADGELEANVWPASDDEALYDDEDGIQWSGDWVTGMYQPLSVQTKGAGYLSLWIDWDSNGEFHADDEKVFELWLDEGSHQIPVLIPMTAVAGDTWMRARFGSASDLQPTGGATDGEVEDHPVTLLQGNVSQRYFPSANGWATLAFEDRWPEEGDYDFNDVVLKYRLTETLSGSDILRVDIEIDIQALGATYHSGFGVSLPGFDVANVDRENAFLLTPTQRQFTASGIDANEAVLRLTQDLYSHLSVSCSFYRTIDSCDSDETRRITLSVPMQASVEQSLMPAFPYDPFIFGTPGYWRGSSSVDIEKSIIEVHLADVSGTALATEYLWQVADDDSIPQLNRYYRTSQNLPWALLFAESWRHPKENVSLLEAYPQFRHWVESDGELSLDWYIESHAISELLF